MTPRGHEIATLEITGHRYILPELLTHRDFSRNVASHRAIPTNRLIDQVVLTPALPVFWGKNQPGMQAKEEISLADRELALKEWLDARDDAVRHARRLGELGVHKQIASRLLEPFSWFTAIVTSTGWSNFLNLRAHPDAQPEAQRLAEAVLEALNGSTPQLIRRGQWHLPYVSDPEISQLGRKEAVKVSAARCARVSYLNHDGTSPVVAKDLLLHDRLLVRDPIHASPAEHQATPSENRKKWGNLRHWASYRKTLPNEYAAVFPRLVGWDGSRA